jgi:hypothetical protein
MVNQNILILRPKFNIFWAIFIRLFLTFNTSDKLPIVGDNLIIESFSIEEHPRMLPIKKIKFQ